MLDKIANYYYVLNLTFNVNMLIADTPRGHNLKTEYMTQNEAEGRFGNWKLPYSQSFHTPKACWCRCSVAATTN